MKKPVLVEIQCVEQCGYTYAFSYSPELFATFEGAACPECRARGVVSATRFVLVEESEMRLFDVA